MSIQWSSLFQFSMSPVEIIVRGTVVYWFIFALLRVAGRRDLGSFGMANILLLVLIADAAQNAMAGDYKSIADGMVLITTLVSWSLAVDQLCYYVPAVRPWFEPDRICLVKNGMLQRRGMRREHITEPELMAALRLKDVESLSDVRRAYMESDGDISVLRRKSRPDP